MKRDHIDFATLLAYWLGDLDEAREGEVEMHYLGCEECCARLAEIESLADGVQQAFTSGLVHAVITPALAERLRAEGLRIREYRVARNGSVNCSVAVEDQLLLSRLSVPLEGVERVDAIVAMDRGGELRLEDVPFDSTSGEVIVAPSMKRVRALSKCQEVVRLVAVEKGSDRLLGEYTFNHSPPPGRS